MDISIIYIAETVLIAVIAIGCSISICVCAEGKDARGRAGRPMLDIHIRPIAELTTIRHDMPSDILWICALSPCRRTKQDIAAVSSALASISTASVSASVTEHMETERL